MNVNTPNPFESRLNVLQQLKQVGAEAEKDPSKLHYVKIFKDQTGEWKLIHTIKETGGLWNRILNKLDLVIFGSRHVDDLKQAHQFFEEVRDNIIKENAAENAEIKDVVVGAFQSIKQLYENHRLETSAEEQIFKNDLVDALSVAYGQGGINEKLDIDIKRIAARTLPEVGRALKSHNIPLFRAEDLEKVNEIFKRDFPGETPTLTQIQNHPELKLLLNKEDVSLGWLVERIYSHRAGAVLNNRVVNWAMTSWMGWMTKRRMAEGPERTEKVVNFFRQMHITLSTDIKNELYSYREMHGRDVRTEETLDGAFQRPLTNEAIKVLMQEADEATKEIQRVCGTETSPVICNAFSRVRVLKVGAGQVHEKFHITGKVLDQDQETTDEVSYGGKFKFSIDKMLGGKADAAPIADPNQAESLFRSILTTALNQEDLTMVVQRLAPADIHHYGMSVGGRVLSVEESCQKLRAMLNASQNPEEAKKLEQLIDWYQNQGKEHADKAFSQVRGTKQSVSTLAVKSASPLSENDRKVMMVEHHDGSISVHTFIGAVGVNNVNIEAERGAYSIGEDLGSMGFGNESIKPTVKAGEVKEQGGAIGGFTKEGSTVVSLYFQKDFVPTATMAETVTHVAYKDKKGAMKNEIEVLTPWGKPIAYPTLYVALRYLKEHKVGDLELFFSNSPDFSHLKNPEKDVMIRLQNEYREWKESGNPISEKTLLYRVLIKFNNSTS